MIPRKGLDVELTDNFTRSYPAFAHLKGKKLSILKIDLKTIQSNGYATYEVFFTDGSFTNSVTVNQTGQVNGVDVFKSWVTKASASTQNQNNDSFDFNGVAVVPQPVGAEPKNNDGRSTCYWCGSPTKHVPGAFTGWYDICTNPSCQK